jgi:hypothetical protein
MVLVRRVQLVEIGLDPGPGRPQLGIGRAVDHLQDAVMWGQSRASARRSTSSEALSMKSAHSVTP